MNTVLVAALALACVLGLATAQYGYPSYGGQSALGGLGFGQGGLLVLIGLLFILLTLFNKPTTQKIAIVNGTSG